MIIKGGRRGGATQLANHLLRRDANEDITIREIDNYPTGSPDDRDLRNALRLMERQATAKGKERTLYHCIIALQKGEILNQHQLKTAVDSLAVNLGLSKHQRVIVEHRKDRRQHFHIVFNIVNPATGKLASLSWSRKKQWDTARQLEKKFGLKPVIAKGRPARQWEHQRGKRTGIDPLNVRKEVTAIYRTSKTGKEFIANLARAGYILTRGRNNSYVIVDRAGDIHGLMRRIEGAKFKDLRQKFPDLKSIQLPELEKVLKTRKRQRIVSPAGKSTRRKQIAKLAPKARISAKGTASRTLAAPAAPRKPTRPSTSAMLALARGRMVRPSHYRKQNEEGFLVLLPARRRKRRRYENKPDSEKRPIHRPEMDTAELIAWAFENGRTDILAQLGIYLSSDDHGFEP